MLEVPQSRKLPSTTSEFWQLSRAAWSTAQHLVDRNVQSMQHAGLEQVRSVLLQYRWFTSYYSGDLAILIYKLPPCSLRSFLAECLDEELGMGNSAETHPAMYDRFLRSLGVADHELETSLDPENREMLETMRRHLLERDYMYGVGLRGMGAECLCQVYLEAVHHYLLKNPAIVERKADIDWTFWDIHASEADQMHGEKSRDLIERLATTPEHVRSLAEGYIAAERNFLSFWGNAYALLGRRASPATAPSPRALTVPLDGWRYDAAR
jgi:Iron-containing redox enzyme